LVWEEVPSHLISRDLAESNQFPRIERKVRRILVASSINRLFCCSLIPLLAGHLTASASGTFGCINKE